MRYLVTGGAGFIGSNLVKALVSKGHKVVVVDNLSTGNRENLRDVKYEVEYPWASVSSFLRFCIGEDKFDGIFHLGIPSSTPLYDETPQLLGRTVTEFGLLLDRVSETREKIVFASTSNLYNGYPTPWKEEMVPKVYVGTRYTETRYYMERMTRLHGLTGFTPIIALRLFSVYGPGEAHKGKLANIVAQMLWSKKEGKAFRVYGDGSQVRDSIWVEDVVEAFIKAMNSDINYGVFNVGTGICCTFNRIAELVGVPTEYIPLPPGSYVKDQLADTSLAKESLGFKSSIPLEEGIKRLKELYNVS